MNGLHARHGIIPIPSDTEAEMDILSAVLLDNKAICVADTIISTGDFHGAKCRTAYEAMRELFLKSSCIDITTLADRLKASGNWKAVGREFLAGLLDRVPTAAAVAGYCGIVKEKSRLRELMRLSERLSASIADGMGYDDCMELMARGTNSMRATNSSKKSPEPIQPIGLMVHREMSDYLCNGAQWGLPVGIKSVDDFTSGLKAEQLTVIAARPGMGKTTVAMQIALNVGRMPGQHVLFFSLEMSREEIIQRMMSNLGGFNLQHVKRRENIDLNHSLMDRGLDAMTGISVTIDDEGGKKLDTLWMDMRAHFYGSVKPTLVIVDYLQLVKTNPRDSEYERISLVSSELKNMAKEFRIPVIALSQLSRGVESREDKRPYLSDLRGSGSIEQDADIVAFLYHEQDSGMLEFIIRKHRGGEKGTAMLEYVRETFTVRHSDAEAKPIAPQRSPQRSPQREAGKGVGTWHDNADIGF